MIKKILALAINEMKIEFSERSTIVFFLILPIVFTYLIGIGLNNMYGSDPDVDPRLPVLVVNKDEGALSADLLEIMDNSETIRPVVKPAEEAQTLFEDGSAAALLDIPANFSSSLLENQPLSLDLHFLENNYECLRDQTGVEFSTAEDGCSRGGCPGGSQDQRAAASF